MKTKEEDYIFPKEIREALSKYDDNIPMTEHLSNPDFINDLCRAAGLPDSEIKKMYNAIGRTDLAEEL